MWLGVLGAVIVTGLASRRFAMHLPTVLATNVGDALYASAMFALIAMIVSRWSVGRVAIAAFIACTVVEVSQLYHAPAIDSIRATRIGGWILGFGFLWSDLVCYAVGVALAASLTALASAGSISARHPAKKES